MRRRVFWVPMLVGALLALGASGCSSSSSTLPSTTATAPAEIGHHVVLAASKLPTGAKASILSGVKLPGTGAVTALSPTYQLTPSGRLSVPTTVTLPLSRPVPAGDEILVATKENASDPWSYLPGQLTADRHSVTFQTNHFSIFGDIGISVSALASAFKTKFLDVMDSGMTASFPQPSCSGEATARSDGFSITSTSGSQVYWCFGMSGSQRILKFVNNSQYPMELSHPDMSVASQGLVNALQNVLNNYGGSYTIAQPGEQVVYNVDVPVNTIGGVQTQADMFGEDLYALDVGLSTLAFIVTELGLGAVKGGAALLGKVVQVSHCASALTSSLSDNPTAIIAGCFDDAAMAMVFGVVLGAVLSLVMAVTSVVQFFRSEFDVGRDMLTGKGHYTVAITHKAAGGGTVSSSLPSTTSGAPSQGGGPATATASNSNGQLLVQLANFPLGKTYYFCHSGTGYPTGGSVASNGSVDVTSANENLGALCSGSGNFWIGFQGTDGHDYYSNQVTLGTAGATATANGSQLTVQLASFPLGTTYYFCHSGTGYPTGGSVASNGSVDVTSANENLGALCSGSGNFWIGFQGTDGHDYYSNQVTLATAAAASPPSATATASGSQLVVQLASFPLGTTYYFCHSGTGYPTGGTIASNSSVNITSANENLGGLCSGSGNFWIGFQGTDGHDYYSNQVTLAGASPTSATATASGTQMVVQLASFPLGTTYYFCHSGTGYPTGGSIASHSSVDITSANENLGALCSGSGNFWIGFQGTDGHDYYSNQVTLG